MNFQGKIKVAVKVLNLNLSLLGGQSFRWERKTRENKYVWQGVACNAYWELQQADDHLTYKVYPAATSEAKGKTNADYCKLLKRYLRLDHDLELLSEQWRKAHPHFASLSEDLKAVRVLNQEPLENIIAFICSQNNNIKRITTMIHWLCSKYGDPIGEFDGRMEYTFPTLDALLKDQQNLESLMRKAKFGYRAKFIAQSVAKIAENGGNAWFDKVRQLPYEEARVELVTLPGIGFKVADCICLMSMNHLQAVPIDTHIYKIAKRVYMTSLPEVKSVTPKMYEDISKTFREIYGDYAGWAQAVLFCSELREFKPEQPADSEGEAKEIPPRKRKKTKGPAHS